MPNATLAQTDLSAEALRNAAEAVAARWPREGGDTNVGDVLHLAYWIQGTLDIPGRKLPRRPVSAKTALGWVEAVDRYLIKAEIIRNLPPAEIGDRVSTLAEAIGSLRDNNEKRVLRLLQALFIWFGAIGMMKSTRTHYNSEAPGGKTAYTQEERWIGFYSVQLAWKRALEAGNVWLRFGVSVGNALARSRKNEIIDRWVPKESPYWGLK
jgi:hypothetical protein